MLCADMAWYAKVANSLRCLGSQYDLLRLDDGDRNEVTVPDPSLEQLRVVVTVG